MKLLKATVENFASYKSLVFNFDGQGLALIAGPTGSGKSTLCDIVPWILFGRTSKGGTVDEIRAWGCTDATHGMLTFQTVSGTYRVSRTRGKTNDLFYREINSGNDTRGRDIPDTQKLINDLLGMDAELYLAGAYFHEFSQTAQFFTASAKNRRSLTEQLVNLDLAKTLALNISEYKKEAKKEVQELVDKTKLRANDLKNKTATLASEVSRAHTWYVNKAKEQKQASERANNFEIIKEHTILKYHEHYEVTKAELLHEQELLTAELKTPEQLLSIKAALDKRESALPDETCHTCGAKKDAHVRLLVTKDRYALQNEENENKNRTIRLSRIKRALETLERDFVQKLSEEERRENIYLAQAARADTEVNPHSEMEAKLTTEIEHIKKDILQMETALREMNVDISDLDLLTDITDEFRQVLVKSTIRDLEQSTNKLLNDHFDAEIRVTFEMEDADKLEVTILKDGNQCTYTQLSKGQRQLLKLCFGVSVMRAVANHHGIRFSNIFMDECLDGADDITKAKGFRLFEKLATEYDSIFIVEHSESIKAMFDKRYDVQLINGHSEISTNE